jgi:signal transduction histidine kinase
MLVGYLAVVISEEALEKSTEESSALIIDIRNDILALLFILLIISILTDVFILQSISEPIIKLREGAVEIGKGNLDTKIKVKSKDELGELSSAFNQMAIDLKKSQTELKECNTGLEKKVKKRTKDLKETIERLKELDKMKLQFLSSISHELRTPLTPIRVQLHRLLTKEIDKKGRKEVLNMILRNSIRLDRLISDLLAVNRIQSNRLMIVKRPAMLSDVAKEAVENQWILAEEKGVAIVNKVPRLNVLIDRDRILEIFINLINNAIKYSDKGQIIVEAKKQKGNVLVSVKDNGIGISKENIDKLFKIFGQIRLEKPGVGLGLFICKGIIEAHGGKTWVKSELGKGTTFYFTIPFK